MQSALRSALAEPLVQFALIGAVLFALDRATRPEEADPKLIEIDARKYAELVEIFRADRERVPTEAEMAAMVDRYIDNEVLYREARALQLDHGDEMMRERMMQQFRLMVYGGITVPEPSEEELRAWVADHAGRYSREETLSFRIVGLDGEEEEARRLAEEFNGAEREERVLTPGDRFAATFRARPRSQLVALFDPKFVAELDGLEPEIWTPVPSYRGWQLVQLLDRTPPVEADFERVRNAARSDWREYMRQREARDRLDQIRATYPVERAPYDPDAFAETAADPERRAEAVE